MDCWTWRGSGGYRWSGLCPASPTANMVRSYLGDRRMDWTDCSPATITTCASKCLVYLGRSGFDLNWISGRLVDCGDWPPGKSATNSRTISSAPDNHYPSHRCLVPFTSGGDHANFNRRPTLNAALNDRDF